MLKLILTLIGTNVLSFFPSLTYTHHFFPYNILYCQKYEHYILFCNWSISIFKSIASSISPSFMHLMYLLFKFLILVPLNTFSCCLFIKTLPLFIPLHLLITKTGHMLIFYHPYTSYKLFLYHYLIKHTQGHDKSIFH